MAVSLVCFIRNISYREGVCLKLPNNITIDRDKIGELASRLSNVEIPDQYLLPGVELARLLRFDIMQKQSTLADTAVTVYFDCDVEVDCFGELFKCFTISPQAPRNRSEGERVNEPPAPDADLAASIILFATNQEYQDTVLYYAKTLQINDAYQINIVRAQLPPPLTSAQHLPPQFFAQDLLYEATHKDGVLLDTVARVYGNEKIGAFRTLLQCVSTTNSR
jgi:hypothetical protein